MIGGHGLRAARPDAADAAAPLPDARDLLIALAPPGAPQHDAWDALAHCAASAAGWPLARLRPVDAARAWLGPAAAPDPRLADLERLLCAASADGEDALEIADARADARFAAHALVAGDPGVRGLVAQPLIAAGLRVGTLCLFDTVPQRLDAAAALLLRGLAVGAAALLVERRARHTLGAEQQRLAACLDLAGDLVWESDGAHRLVRVVGTAERPGVPRFVIGNPLPDLPLLDATGSAPDSSTTLYALLAGRARFEGARIGVPGPAGTHHLALSAQPRRDARGHWCGFRGVARDIGAALRSEQARQAAEARLQGLCALRPDLPCELRLEPEGRLSLPYAGIRIRELFGVEPVDVQRDATPALARCRPSDRTRLLDTLVRSAHDQQAWALSLRVTLPGRAERLLSVRATRPAPGSDGSVRWHCSVSDAGEAHEQAERIATLGRERDAALRIAEQRGELMTRVSHELRTPLNAVLGFAQLIQRDTAAADTATTRSAFQIRRAGKHMVSLIDDMLDLSALEAGRVPLALQAVPLLPVVDRVLRLLEAHAAEHGVALEARLDGAPPAVRADPRAVQQLLFNLIGNAIKFSARGDTVHVRLQWHERAAFVALEVTDQGPGIAPHQLASIFEPFTRLNQGGGAVPGSGLGLTICRQLVIAMDGRIDVASEPGQGSRFTVQLPVDDAFATPVDLPDTGFGGFYDNSTDSALGAGRVLYIEDDRLSTQLMQQFFATLPDVELQVATRGAEGVAAAAACRPDLVLLDMNLPDLHGLEVLRRLRADAGAAGLPIVGLSAEALPMQRQAARAAGCNDYWTKPLDLGRLQQGLKRWLPQRSAAARLGAPQAI